MYAVCGASGNIGRAVALGLLDKGEKVRVIGRSQERLQPLVDKGAEAVVADLTDVTALNAAFEGCQAVFTMIPPNMAAENFREFQNQVGDSIARAVKSSGIKHVVNLSSVGAHLPEGTGPINGLYDQEQRLNQLDGVNVIHLRPASFFENHLWQIDAVKQHGMMATAQDPDVPIAQIATGDIADYATDRMTGLDFEGHVTRELLGSAEYSLNEVAAAIGRAIGKDDLKYQRVTYDDSRQYFGSVGMSPSVSDNMIELYEAFNEGRLEPTESRTPENSTPTNVDSFSALFAQIYNS